MSKNYTNKEVGVRDLLIVSLLGFLASNVLPFALVVIGMGAGTYVSLAV